MSKFAVFKNRLSLRRNRVVRAIERRLVYQFTGQHNYFDKTAYLVWASVFIVLMLYMAVVLSYMVTVKPIYQP